MKNVVARWCVVATFWGLVADEAVGLRADSVTVRLSPPGAFVQPTETPADSVFHILGGEDGSGPAILPDSLASVTEILRISNTELWVQGQSITDSVVQCSYSDGEIAIGGALLVSPPVGDGRLPSELVRLFERSPYVQSLERCGTPAYDAAEAYHREYQELLANAQAALNLVGQDSALAVLSESPLVERVEAAGRQKVQVRMRGIPVWRSLTRGGTSAPVLPLEDRQKVALRLFPLLRVACTAPSSNPRLVFVGSGLVAEFSGAISDEARAQLQYVVREGTVSGAPDGPLSREVLKEALLNVSH